MDQSTADALLSLVSRALQAAADVRLRLDAFERVMDGHNPGVSAAWRREIENLRNRTADQPDAALAALRQKLLVS